MKGRWGLLDMLHACKRERGVSQVWKICQWDVVNYMLQAYKTVKNENFSLYLHLGKPKSITDINETRKYLTNPTNF